MLIAQYYDTSHVRMPGGSTLPVLRCFNVGDYVYYRNNGARTSLDGKAKPKVYYVMEVNPTGEIV